MVQINVGRNLHFKNLQNALKAIKINFLDHKNLLQKKSAKN
jgi:hypothetical protein